MDNVVPEEVPLILEHWAFIALGVFTTCCFSRNFVALDLLRRPYDSVGDVSGQVVAFNLPEWFPHEQAILRVGKGDLFSKLRDLPVIREKRPGTKKTKILSLKLPFKILDYKRVVLTYSPWFRFAHSGRLFSIQDSMSVFLCRIVEYASRRALWTADSIETASGMSSVHLYKGTARYRFSATGKEILGSVNFSSNQSQVCLNFEARSLTLSAELTPTLFEAVNQILNPCS